MRPADWPLLALRRSAAMQRYSPLNSSIALKGSLKPEIVEFNPPPAMSNKGPFSKKDPDVWPWTRHSSSMVACPRRLVQRRNHLIVGLGAV